LKFNAFQSGNNLVALFLVHLEKGISSLDIDFSDIPFTNLATIVKHFQQICLFKVVHLAQVNEVSVTSVVPFCTPVIALCRDIQIGSITVIIQETVKF
jgi:hypothetical protein